MSDVGRSEFLAGARAELPICLGVLPFGLIFGVVAVGAGLPAGLGLAMSSLVFAGSAQFLAVQLLHGGASALIILAATLVINLRHLLYSFSLAPHLQRLAWPWKGLLAYLLTDEAYAVVITRYQNQPGAEGQPADPRYFLGAGLTLWTTWQLSTAAGVFLGAQIPASWSLDFALTLTFIGLVVPSLRDRAVVAAALAGGTLAALAAGAPYHLGLMLAALGGIAAGLAVERLERPRSEAAA